MADLVPLIETLEHRLMRAWVARDARTLKALTSRKFRLVIGSKPCVILDAPSWLHAATERFLCSGYRFSDIYVHALGGVAIFATHLSLEATLDDRDWSREVWLTDVWRKPGVGRGWRLVDRVLSRSEDDSQVPLAVRRLQLWR
jgi:hypothetical protein